MIHIKVRANNGTLTVEAKKMTLDVQNAVVVTLYRRAANKLNMPFSRLLDDCIKLLEVERRMKNDRIHTEH